MHILFLPCSQATLLMEKRNAQNISGKESFKLSLHLAICKWCRAYEEKLKLLDDILKRKVFSDKNIEIKETEIQDFKNKLVEKLEKE